MSGEPAEVQGEIRFGDNIEVITNPEQVKGLLPSITVRATRPGIGDDEIFVLKINQPYGRALLIAVHL
jgi:nitrogen regulatory protein PII